MSFTENLRIKISIKSLAQKVRSSLGPVGSSSKVDKEAMGQLLLLARYAKQENRELVLYCKKRENRPDRILVLDNDLTIYHTTLDDVLLRKNPTVKEMISIRNAIKILNDKDVVVTKKENTVHEIEKEAISFLDLSCTRQDIETIKTSGIRALETGDAQSVLQSIDLFSELLGYQDAPAWLRLGGFLVRGGVTTLQNRSLVFGPVLIYNLQENEILLVNDRMEAHEREKIELTRQVALGKATADLEGSQAFDFLQKEVVFHHLTPNQPKMD